MSDQKTNKGFSERIVMNRLNSAQKNYDQLMKSIEDYQESGIAKIAQAWPSVKGKKVVDGVTTNINEILRLMENAYELFFNMANTIAEKYDKDQDGINFKAVKFVKSNARFKLAGIEARADGSIDFISGEVKEGISQMEKFLSNRLLKNFEEISADFTDIGEALSLGNKQDAEEFRAELRKYLNNLESLINEHVSSQISQIYTRFEADATELSATVREVRETQAEALTRTMSEEPNFVSFDF